MARLPRFVIPNQPQHVIVRGNNRVAIFYADTDYCCYLDKLKQACAKHSCDSEHYLLSCYRYIELNPVRAGR
jgi:putative transposase